MTHVISLCCAILMVITVGETIVPHIPLPNGNDCPDEMSIPSKLNHSKTGASLANQGNDILTCACVDKSCKSLCCPTGKLIPHFEFHDITSVEDTSGLVMSSDDNSTEVQNKPIHLGAHRLPENPCAGSKMVRLRLEQYILFPNGSIYLGFSKRITYVEDFLFRAVDRNFVYTIEYCDAQDGLITRLLDKLSVAPVIVSIPCLLITFVVYSAVPELRTMSGLTLRGYVGPLAVYYIIIAVLSFAPEINDTNGDLCVFLGILMYFSGLSSFFWLNVMCFHIWWTFEKSIPSQSGVSHWRQKKFIKYSTYAWGSALLITGICMIMHFYPNLPESVVRPQFGVEGCFFGSKDALALYYYGPVGLTIVFNTLFFASTALKLLQQQKENAHHLRGKDSQCHNANRQRINIHLKFFIIMGISWTTDVASYFCNESPKYLWSTTDFINRLQGVIILVMFVLTNNTKKKIWKLLGRRKNKYELNKYSRSAFYTSTSRICTMPTVHNKNKKLPHC